MKNVIATEKAPKAIGPYSQAIVSNGFAFLSGQIPLDPATGQIVAGGIAEQTERVIENIRGVLEACGASLESVVKTTVFLTDRSLLAPYRAARTAAFAGHAPASTLLFVAGLADPKFMVEIEAEAVA